MYKLFFGNTIFDEIDNNHQPNVKNIIKKDPTQLNRVKNGYTPLMYACLHENDPIASYLISIGADVDYKNKKGETAQSISDKLNFVPSIYLMYNKYKHIYSYAEILEYYRLLIIWQDGNLERNIILRNYLQRMPGVTLTVYRANKRSKEIRNTMYFSTSTDMYETKKFVGDGCCTFIIHLVNVPAYYFGPEYESEYLVLGGGTFWKDAELTITGFNEIESGLFECWYTPPAIQPTDNMSECHITKHQTLRGIILPNTQMGSNPGGIFISNNACKYYLKYQNNNDRAEQEVLASKLYSLAGIKCANVELAMYNNKLVSLSNWVQSSESKQSISDMDIQSEIQKGFAIDAWLANWDVIGQSFDNIIVDTDGNPVRIDTGGALEYRAMGAHKDFSPERVDEYYTMREPKRKSSVFKFIPKPILQITLNNIKNINDNTIKELVETHISNHHTQLRLFTALISRKNILINLLMNELTKIGGQNKFKKTKKRRRAFKISGTTKIVDIIPPANNTH